MLAGCVNNCCCPSAVLVNFSIAAPGTQTASEMNASLVQSIEGSNNLSTCLLVGSLQYTTLCSSCSTTCSVEWGESIRVVCQCDDSVLQHIAVFTSSQSPSSCMDLFTIAICTVRMRAHLMYLTCTSCLLSCNGMLALLTICFHCCRINLYLQVAWRSAVYQVITSSMASSAKARSSQTVFTMHPVCFSTTSTLL